MVRTKVFGRLQRHTHAATCNAEASVAALRGDNTFSELADTLFVQKVMELLATGTEKMEVKTCG